MLATISHSVVRRVVRYRCEDLTCVNIDRYVDSVLITYEVMVFVFIDPAATGIYTY